MISIGLWDRDWVTQFLFFRQSASSGELRYPVRRWEPSVVKSHGLSLGLITVSNLSILHFYLISIIKYSIV